SSPASRVGRPVVLAFAQGCLPATRRFTRCADGSSQQTIRAVKILAVEDDALSRAVLRQALRKLGHEVLEEANGEDAWTRLAREPVRVVVSDWAMPQMDGLELCRKIRNTVGAEYTYFILLTARDNSGENQQAAADAGVDDFLTKPLNFDELWNRLRVAERILRYATQVRQLEEMMPICSYCKKIRDDHNYWQQIEGYINERTGSEFSHSICPDCYQRVVIPELEKLKARKQ
ncbi:MAG: response regulator receiver protein, partial [Verrucomicrobia bacterium]|nr:response regulator receiver protein [Verrucomicrobiota bacterium]